VAVDLLIVISECGVVIPVTKPNHYQAAKTKAFPGFCKVAEIHNITNKMMASGV